MCEEEIKKVTASVFKYILPKSWSEEKKEANPITAEEIVEAIKDGKDVEIKNAVITGPFILKSVNVEGEITIENTKIRDKIDWSYATFKRVLNLESSIFETDATFTAVTVEKDIFLDGATFCEKAVFADITVMGAFYSSSTTFKKDVIFSDGIVKKGIAFSKSTFVGEANFERARIDSGADFTGAEFKEQANFSSAQIDGHASFKPANLFNIDVEFKALFNIDVEFKDDLNNGIISEKLKNIFKTKHYSLSENAKVTKEKADKWRITDREKIYIVKKEEGKLNIYKPTTFVGEANFVSARIGGNAEFKEAEFKESASFNSAQIEGSAFFNPATFDGDADFISARIGGTADFTGAEFKQLAIFNRAQIEESAFFNPATFKGEANFGSARIGSNAEFTEAVFKKKANFNGARIEGSAFFNPATFDGDADFISARIGSTADFTGAEFMKQAIFNGAQIEESAFFNPATFVGDADFISARIGSTAEFTGATFKQQASFNGAQIEGDALFKSTIFDEADFGSARIGSNAEFQGAEFKQQVYFNSAQIERESHFEGTVFDNDVSFQNASLRTLIFGEPNVQFIKNIDLRGCTYDRIQPISFWEQLMKHLGPYDRQPFTQLEETFRRAGKDKLADDVYYERKCREYTENIAIRKYLFSWDCVPGDDDEKLKKFLEDDLDIGWTDNAEIRKSDDGNTLSISKDEKRSEIILVKKKATLKIISDGRTFYLNVKKKHGKRNIYRTWGAWLNSALRKHGSWCAWLNSASRKLSAWLLDWFLLLLTGYGVRLYRLLMAFVLILMLGTYIFQLEGAVTPELHSALPCSEAFWVSLNTFLPIGIPSGADWKPSSQIIPYLGIKFTTFATFLDLAGWILVPVGIAGIAGLLKRPK